MDTTAIVDLIKNLGVIVVGLAVGFTAVLKKIFPKVEPLFFSVPLGVAFTAVAFFATQPFPVGLAGWSVFALTILGGALLPSGLFAASVDVLKKATKK